MAEKLSTMRNGLLHTIYGWAMVGLGAIFTLIYGLNMIVLVLLNWSLSFAQINAFLNVGGENLEVLRIALSLIGVMLLGVACFGFSIYFIISGIKIARRTYFSDDSRRRAIWIIVFDLVFLGWTIFSNRSAGAMALEIVTLVLSLGYLGVRVVEDSQLQS